MALTKYKLGQLIELTTETNESNLFGADDVRGMTITKQIIPTKADVSTADLGKFLVIHPNEFVFNPRTHGKHIGFGYNDTRESFIISWNNIGFRVKEEMKDVILSEYLFLHFNRDEWDREACFRSWGSSTEVFTWAALCEMELELPDLPIQQKYVDIYKAMVANQQSYERGLDDLKLVCDAYIEDLRRKYPCEKIGGYIRVGEKNKDEKVSNVLGIGQAGFIKPQKKPNESLKNYKILKPKMIAYAPPLYNMLTGAIHYYDGEELAVCSPIYEVFECRDKLLPNYLILWLKREEFKRYAAFFAAGVRGTFDYEFMEDVEIPIPDIQVQKAIAGMYSVYVQRKELNEKLKAQIKNICPILIKGSLEEGKA